jgi:hypothetical protein
MLECLNNNWSLVPSHPTSIDKIDRDMTKPFLMPDLKVWIVRKLPEQYISNVISYDCPFSAEHSSNGFIAISVNQKSPYLMNDDKVDMIVKYMSTRTTHSVILIADDIARFNIEAFDKMTPVESYNAAIQLGDTFTEKFTNSAKKYGPGLRIVRWKDLGYPVDIDSRISELLLHPVLKERVELIADRFINHRGQGQIKSSYEKKKELIVKYILSELPVLVCGIQVEHNWYRLLYYSGSKEHLSKFADDKNSLHNLVLDILNKPEFAGVKALIPILIGFHKGFKVGGFFGINID